MFVLRALVLVCLSNNFLIYQQGIVGSLFTADIRLGPTNLNDVFHWANTLKVVLCCNAYPPFHLMAVAKTSMKYIVNAAIVAVMLFMDVCNDLYFHEAFNEFQAHLAVLY